MAMRAAVERVCGMAMPVGLAQLHVQGLAPHSQWDGMAGPWYGGPWYGGLCSARADQRCAPLCGSAYTVPDAFVLDHLKP